MNDFPSEPDRVRNPARLAALRDLELHPAAGEAFDRLTRLAARFLRTPVSLVTLIESDRQILLGHTGLAEHWAARGEMPLEYSYCRHALGSPEPLLIEDAREDPRVSDSPALHENRSISYAGVPLVLESGHALGTLCVVDERPRRWTDEEVEVLRDLAAGVMTEIELRRDLAERARTEEALRRQSELLDLAQEGILVRDLNDEIRYWNRGAERLYGWSAGEAVGRTSHEVLGTEFLSPREEIERQLRDRGFWEGDLLHTTRSGEPIVVSSRWALQRDGSGAAVAVLEINRDITARRRAEQALQQSNERLEAEVEARTAELRESEERFRALVENGSEVITVVCADGSIKYKSPAVLQELGYAPEELIGRNVFEFVHEEDREAVRAAFEEVIEEATPAALELRFRHRTGSYRLLQAVGTSLLGERAVAGVVVNSRDITELRQGEERLRQAHKMEAIGRLAGGISHDFNNILNVIVGNTHLALMELSEESPVREEVLEIQAAAERAATLTRQLLAFSRQQVLQPRPLDLNEVVREIEKMLRRTLGEDVDLVARLDPQLGRIKADRGQIEQILLNLAVNARDAMPGGGKLLMETEPVRLGAELSEQFGYEVKPGSYALLAVTDTGTGMPKEVRDRIFEPFFTTKPQGKGTGLGLATVYGIVKQSGGYIWVYSEEGRGTSFKIYLPLNDEETPPPEEGAIQEPAPRRTGTVLVVEDEEGVRRLVRRVLESAGYDVLEAADGAEALRLAESHTGEIGLLLTDVVMPVLGGRELAERLRAVQPDLPVLFSSGYTQDGAVENALLEPGTRMLQKPYSPDDLLRRVGEFFPAGDGAR